MESKYYIVVTEWEYPNESGREVITDFDSRDDAIVRCFELCEDELDNYWKNCGDYLPPAECYDDDVMPSGVCITPKNGLDDWFFHAKVIEVKFG